jgi:lysophospholipase L1-like esterase
MKDKKNKVITALSALFLMAALSLFFNVDRAYALEADIKPLQGRTIYCVGDSITLAIGGNKDINGRYISFSDYLGQYSGATVYNSSFEGVQIGDYGINNCIMQRIYGIPVDTSVIVFWAGVDDFIWGTPMNYGRYKQDVDYAFSYMKNNFPLTKIIIVTTYKNRSEKLRTDRGATFAQFMQYQIDAASRYGFSVVDLYNTNFSPLKTPEYFADDIHPNDAGNRLIADIIYKKILEGS